MVNVSECEQNELNVRGANFSGVWGGGMPVNVSQCEQSELNVRRVNFEWGGGGGDKLKWM